MKEVIFHIFPSARFLGLSLKILFHKNKEIKRMLSKKMTVSLMSLITILALAFVMSPAMADIFRVKVPDRNDFADRTITAGFLVTVRQDPEVVQYAAVANQQADTDRTLDTMAFTIDWDVEFAHPVGDLLVDHADVVDADEDTDDDQPYDIGWRAFDAVGNEVPDTEVLVTLEADLLVGQGPNLYPHRTASKRRIRLTFTPVIQALPVEDPDRGRVTRIVLSFAQIPTIDPTIAVGSNTSASGTVDVTVHQPIAQAGSAAADTDFDTPRVVSIQRLRPGSQTVVAAFQEAAVTGPFDVRIVTSELPAGFTVDHIIVAGGTASDLVAGTPFRREGEPPDDIFAPTRAELLHTTKPHPREGMYEHDNLTDLLGVPEGVLGSGPVPYTTGDDMMYHQYRVRISPHRRATRVVITIGAFHDGDSPYNNYYQPGVNAVSTPNGREKLDLRVALEQFPLKDGYKVVLPHDNGAQITYAGGPGNYILAKNKEGSSINYFREAGIFQDVKM